MEENTRCVTCLRIESTNICKIMKTIFSIFLAQIFINVVLTFSSDFEDFLLCRQCGYEIAHGKNLIVVPSTLAHRQRNDTVAGSKQLLIQLFQNPQGKYFEVVTTKAADVLKVGKSFAADSWFPGFEWTICVCPRCGFHMGWSFSAMQDLKNTALSFYGLVLDNILQLNEADSLIAVPKSYAS